MEARRFDFGEIDLLLGKLQKPHWSGPMASCPPGRATAHARAGQCNEFSVN